LFTSPKNFKQILGDSLFTSQCFYVNIDVTLDVLIVIKTLDCKNWHHLKFVKKIGTCYLKHGFLIVRWLTHDFDVDVHINSTSIASQLQNDPIIGWHECPRQPIPLKMSNYSAFPKNLLIHFNSHIDPPNLFSSEAKVDGDNKNYNHLKNDLSTITPGALSHFLVIVVRNDWCTIIFAVIYTLIFL